VVNLRSGTSQLLAAADGADAGPLLLANVAAILPAEAVAAAGGSVGRVTDLLVLTAVGGWLGGSDGTAPFSWSLLRHVSSCSATVYCLAAHTPPHP
jgi:hypothetical protein